MFTLLFLLAAPGTSVCFAAGHALPAAAPLTAEDLVPIACDSTKPAARVRYDRGSRGPRLTKAVAAGAYIGRLSVEPGSRVAKGDRLTLRSSAGPVVIEREVTALQQGRSGQRIFVQDANGAVFAVRLQVQDGSAR